MRRYLLTAVAGAALAALAGCVSGPARSPAPAAATAPAAASSSDEFAAAAAQMHSPRLMAMVLLRQARAKHDGDRAIMAALFALRAGDYDLATEATGLAHRYEPKRPEPSALDVRIALDRGRFAAARKAAAETYALGGADAVELALSAPIDNWFAYALVQPLVRAHPKDSSLQLLWAQTALSAGDSATALAAARAAGSDDAKVIEIQALWDLGRRKPALALAQKTLAAQSHAVGLRVFVAGLLARSGEAAKAREILDDAAALAPDNRQVALGYALADVAAGNAAAARARLTSILETGSDAPGVYNLLGGLAADRGDWGEAFGWYQSITDGSLVDTAQAAAVFALERWQDAAAAQDYLSHLRRGLPALDPTWASVQATLLQDAGRNEQAYTTLSAAVMSYPMVRPLRYQQALAADRIGKSSQALDILRKLLGEEPGNPEYLNAYGYMLVERTHRYHEAYDYISKALDAAPNDGAVLDSMGWVLFKLGEPHKALPYLSRAWKLTGDEEVAGHLVQTYVALGDVADASKVLADALSKSPDNQALLKLKQQLAAGHRN